MCLVCKEDLAEIEKLRRNIESCPCPDRVRPPRAKYQAEYYQRNREKKLAAANERHRLIRENKYDQRTDENEIFHAKGGSSL